MVGRGVRRCCNWFLGLLVQDSDTVEEVRIKRRLFPVCMVLCVFASWGVLHGVQGSLFMHMVGASICVLGTIVFMAGVVFNAAPAGYLVDAMLAFETVGLCLMDLHTAAVSRSFRSWSYVVLVLDIALVFNRNHLPRFVLPLVLVYLAGEHIESAAKFGLYDAGYWGTGVKESYCNCVSPPCTVDAEMAFDNFLSVCMVIILDFYFTRGFAMSMRVQLQSIESSVRVSEDVAAALARYDVDEAEKVIAKGDDLHPGLTASFMQLLSNLRSYKAYLPHSCLVPQDSPL
eukprot:Hpha_TRINITY_DN16323_c2_g1::TRINITY_DN16323_c2_g1_i1::g.60780::m.60780